MHHHTPYLRMVFFLLSAVALLSVVHAAPLLVLRQAITTLSADQISPYKPYTWFASTGYCSPATTITWTCGGKHPQYLQ
jgi:hypothetical protein